VSLETPAEEQSKLHNRWHPDIPFADTIKNGETVKIECVSRLSHKFNPTLTRVQIDWTGGQIGLLPELRHCELC
jgi:formamidase